MDEKYDAVILGTGVSECVLSALLSVEGKKVLHIDRGQVYGGEMASLNLTQLYEKFRPGAEPPKDWVVTVTGPSILSLSLSWPTVSSHRCSSTPMSLATRVQADRCFLRLP